MKAQPPVFLSRTILVCSLAGFVSAVSIRAQQPEAEPARVVAQLRNRDVTWVGQRLDIIVDLYAQDPFTGVASFQFPEVAGLLFAPLGGRPTVRSETIDEVAFNVQRHEIALFARRAGEHVIPAFMIRFAAKKTLSKVTQTYSLNTGALSFVAVMPPGAESYGSVICTGDLTVTETWVPLPRNPRVGDAFVRTITMRASDIPGMVFAQIPELEPSRVREYRKPASIEDNMERGDFTGSRTEVLTYLCERPGEVSIPALSFPWFDTKSELLRKVELPSKSWTVLSRPELASGVTPVGPKRWTYGLLLLTFAGVGWLAWRPVRDIVRKRAKRRLESEASRFRGLCQSVQSGDARLALGAFYTWAQMLSREAEAVTIESLGRTAALDGLASAAGSEVKIGDIDALLVDLRAIRERLKKVDGRKLPPMNGPGSVRTRGSHSDARR